MKIKTPFTFFITLAAASQAHAGFLLQNRLSIGLLLGFGMIAVVFYWLRRLSMYKKRKRIRYTNMMNKDD